MIRGIIDLLSSPEVVVDDRHSPKLWSRFLDGLLATPAAKIELSPSTMKGGNSLPRRSLRRPVASNEGSPSPAALPSSGLEGAAVHPAQPFVSAHPQVTRLIRYGGVDDIVW